MSIAYTYSKILNQEEVYSLDPILGFVLHYIGGADEVFYAHSLSLSGLILLMLFLIVSSIGFRSFSRNVFSWRDSIFASFAIAIFVLLGPGTAWQFVPLLYFSVAWLGCGVLCRAVDEGLCGMSFFGAFLFVFGLWYSGPLAFLICVLCFLFFPAPLDARAVRHVSTVTFLLVSLLIAVIGSENSVLFAYPLGSVLVPLSPLVDAGAALLGPYRIPMPTYYTGFIERYEYSRNIFIYCVFPMWTYLIFRLLPAPITILRTYILESAVLRIGMLLSFFYIFYGYFRSYYDYLVSFYRFVPGLIWRVDPSLLGVLILFFVIGFSSISTEKTRRICISILLFSCISVYFVQALFADSKQPLFVSYLNPQENKLPLSLTPSRFSNLAYGKEILPISSQKLSYEIIGLSSCSANTNVNEASAKLALDGNSKTRWSTAGPQQEGDFFNISCDDLFRFTRIRLLLPPSGTDFPRGFAIEVSDGSDDYHRIFESENWYGPLRKTDEGLTYFGAQGNVALDFPSVIEGRNLRVVLLSGDPVFDWSISELVMYRADA